MTLEQLKKDLRISLDHFVGLGNVLKVSYSSLYPSEQGVMVYALLVAGRRLASLVKEVQTWQERFIPNITEIDWAKTHGDLLAIMDYLPQCNCDMQISMSSENMAPTFDSDMIVVLENLRLWFPPKEQAVDYTKARKLMIEASEGNYAEMKDAIDEVDRTIEKLLADSKNLIRNKEVRKYRLNTMRAYYLEKQWEQDKVLLVNRAKGEIKDKDNAGKTRIEILQSLLQDIISDNTIGNSNRDLGYINEQRLDDDSLAAIMVEKRNKLTVDDIMEHFKFVESEKLLKDYIDSEELTEACDKYQGKLFVNKAAMEFTTLIKGIVERYMDFYPKQNAAFYYATLKELSIVKAEENNATQMAEYLSNVYHEKISDDNITKPLRNCLGKRFGSLNDQQHGEFNDKNFAKQKDIYWRCHSIVIKLLDIEDLMCADYLKEPHPEIASQNLFEGLDEAQQKRLRFVSSVLRGDSPKI